MSTLSRRKLTDLLVATLEATSVPVGRGEAPPAGGWTGQPNAPGSYFTPYYVLIPQAITATSGPVNDPQGDVQAPYALESFGLSQGNCEGTADKGREALDALKKTTVSLGTFTYTIQQVWVEVIGGVSRVAGTDPPYYGESDTLTVWLTR